MSEDFFDDPEFQELIKEYLIYLNTLVKKIEDGIDDKEFTQVRKIGHNIKGSGGGYGFQELTDIGKEIEFGGKDEDITQIASGLKKLKEFLSKC